jgi:hypothetical protein
MYKTGKIAFLATSLILVLTGCGDQKTPRDIELQRSREQINQRLAELQPLVGQFDGTLLDSKANQNRRFRLNVVLSGQPVTQTNAPDEITAPTLSASIWFYSLDPGSDVYVIYPFDQSDYDASTKALTFYSDNPKGSLQVTVLNNNQLNGAWSNNVQGMVGQFNVTRTSSP